MNSGKWGVEERKAFTTRGRIRVMDGANDMVVEYVGSAVAAMILAKLGKFGVFSFASEASISTTTVLTLCMYQLIPEIFADCFCTFMEVSNGASQLHREQWSWTEGAEPNSPSFLLKKGNRVKALGCEMCSTVFLTAVCLCLGINSA